MDFDKVYPEGPTDFGLIVMEEMDDVFGEDGLSEDAEKYLLWLSDEVVKDPFDPSDIARLKLVIEVLKRAVKVAEGLSYEG